jgi:hypothetical protein
MKVAPVAPSELQRCVHSPRCVIAQIAPPKRIRFVQRIHFLLKGPIDVLSRSLLLIGEELIACIPSKFTAMKQTQLRRLLSVYDAVKESREKSLVGPKALADGVREWLLDQMEVRRTVFMKHLFLLARV